MISRTRLLITALLACHLLMAPRLVTSQLPPPKAQEDAPAAQQAAGHGEQSQEEKPLPPIAGAPARSEEVTIHAIEQEKQGDVYTLRGQVEIRFRTFIFRADQVTYDAASGQITASGNVVFEGGPHDEMLHASRATYHLRSETGSFEDVTGTTGAKLIGGRAVLTSSSPFTFQGKLVEKTGPTRYVVHHGSVTTCRLPDPIWTLDSERVVVEPGDDATIYNTTFRIRGVPLLYLPWMRYPVEHLGRQSGLLVPSMGQSSRKGFVLGESFYWAISRSMDATLGAAFYSKRGWAQEGEYRWRPTEHSFLVADYFGVVDRGQGSQGDQGGQDIHLNGEARFPWGFRGVADLNYLSSFVFRLAFTEVFTEAVNSEVKSSAFLSRPDRGYFVSFMGRRYQNFQSTEPGDVVTIWHAPTIAASSVDRPLARTPLYWGFDAAVEGLSRSEPKFETADLVGRIDLHPRASLPLHFGGWDFRPEVALRETYYSDRRLDTGGIGVPVREPVNRKAFEGSIEVRPPVLSRIFQGSVLGRTLKHTIEPHFTYRFVTGVENFPNIIRFDQRDILSNTNELEYGVVNRIYAKRNDCSDRSPQPAIPDDLSSRAQRGTLSMDSGRAGRSPDFQSSCPARQIISWEVSQKYFLDDDFGGALVNGKRNVFTTSALFSGIAFLTEPRRFSPVVSKLRITTGADTDVDWQLDIDPVRGRLNSSTTLVQHHFGEFFLGGSHAFLQAPGEIFTSTPLPSPPQFNQFRALLGWGHPNKPGWNAASNIGFDVRRDFLQYATFQGTYNWDCCGITVEFRRFALGSVRNENQVRFGLTLADIGTFGNLRRREEIY